MDVASLAGFVEAVQDIVDEWTPKGAGWYLQPWFRGHGSASWPLAPGRYRSTSKMRGIGAEYYNEALLLQKFRLRAPTYLERLPATDWEWLFLMQHYGLPTRLLDWTASSLIALYFAIRDHAGDVDAAVWALNPWWLNKQTFGDYVLFSADDPRANDHSPLIPGRELKGRLPLAIAPSHASQRIAAQRGEFIIHGHAREPLDRMALRIGEEPNLRKLVIRKKHIGKVRQELAIAGNQRDVDLSRVEWAMPGDQDGLLRRLNERDDGSVKYADREARFERDPAKYDAMVKTFIKIAFDDVASIPLHQPYAYVAMQKRISGYRSWFHRQMDYRTLVKA